MADTTVIGMADGTTIVGVVMMVGRAVDGVMTADGVTVADFTVAITGFMAVAGVHSPTKDMAAGTITADVTG